MEGTGNSALPYSPELFCFTQYRHNVFHAFSTRLSCILQSMEEDDDR